MDEQDILEKIVVAISRDCKTRCGTGFYVSEDKIATCYHVLFSELNLDGGVQETKFWVQHDGSEIWIEARPIKCSPLPDDIAILQSIEKNGAALESIFYVFDDTDAPSKFRSKGYDEKLEKLGATWVDGDIYGHTYLRDFGPSRRLQLSTRLKAIKGGRSGSPVFSSSIKKIVGMIDYISEEMSGDTDIVTAIPIEAIISLVKSAKSIHLEEEPNNLKRRIADRIYYNQNELKKYKDTLLLEKDKEKREKLNVCIEKIGAQIDADRKDSIMIEESVAKSANEAEDQDRQSRD